VTAPQPGPVEAERDAMDQLIQALAYAQSAKVVLDALTAFSDVAPEVARLLLTWSPLRRVLAVPQNASGPVSVQSMHRVNLMRRASYLVQAARRLTTGWRRSRKGGDPDVLRAVWQRELRFLQQHLEAHIKRARAAREVARVTREALETEVPVAGDMLPRGLVGWKATIDDRTTPDCRRADGRNFDPTKVPAIGFPGTVHPHCRCKPVAPYRTDLRVEALRPDMVAVVSGRARGESAELSGSSWQIVVLPS
jgi:hypothetical protein